MDVFLGYWYYDLVYLVGSVHNFNFQYNYRISLVLFGKIQVRRDEKKQELILIEWKHCILDGIKIQFVLKHLTDLNWSQK